ncbi:hypothetical protein Tco_0698310 [Tanacetum coccineum]
MGILYKSMEVQLKVGFKQLGPGVETGIHEVHDEKRVWFEVELQGAHEDREAEVFQVSNDDTAVAQRRLKDKQPEEKTNTDCLVKEKEKECQTGWKIKTGNVLDSCHQRSPSSVIGFKKHIDMLEFFGWLASIKQGMLEPVKVKCVFLGYHENIVGNKLWSLDDVTSKVVLYRNMGFNESGEYKKTFIDSGVGMRSDDRNKLLLGKYTQGVYQLKELGEVKKILGIEIIRDRSDAIGWHSVSVNRMRLGIRGSLEAKTVERIEAVIESKFDVTTPPLLHKDSALVIRVIGDQIPTSGIRAQWHASIKQRMLEPVMVKWELAVLIKVGNIRNTFISISGLARFARKGSGLLEMTITGILSRYVHTIFLYIDGMYFLAEEGYIGLPKLCLKGKFNLKELGGAKKILGMEIIMERSHKILRVSQSGLSFEGLPVRECDVERMSKVPYVKCVGSLMYLKVTRGPRDIAYLTKGTLEGVRRMRLNYVAVNCDSPGAIHLSRGILFLMKGISTYNVRFSLLVSEVLEAKDGEVLNVGTEHILQMPLSKVKVPGTSIKMLELLCVGIG